MITLLSQQSDFCSKVLIKLIIIVNFSLSHKLRHIIEFLSVVDRFVVIRVNHQMRARCAGAPQLNLGWPKQTERDSS